MAIISSIDSLKLSSVSQAAQSEKHESSIFETIAKKILPIKSDMDHFERAITGNFRYQYIKPLGEGSFGIVLLAHDTTAKMDIVVKISKKQKHNVIIQREGKNLSYLNSLNSIHSVKHLGQKTISVGLYRSTEVCPRAFLFSTYGGKSIQTFCEKNAKKRPFSDFFYLFTQAINYWQFLENSNLVQRDIKPRNLILNGSVNDVGSLKFIDTSSLGEMNTVEKEPNATTRRYRSPDTLLKKFSASEVPFALAATFYEILTGEFLFSSEVHHLDSENIRVFRHLQVVFETFGFPDASFFEDFPEDVRNKLFVFLKMVKNEHHVESKDHTQSRIEEVQHRIQNAMQSRFVLPISSTDDRDKICSEVEDVFRALVVNRKITTCEILEMPLFKRFQAIVDKQIKQPHGKAFDIAFPSQSA